MYKNRRLFIQAFFSLVVLIYLARLFYLQVIDISLVTQASDNVVRKKTVYPSRGLIYDRNGKLIVVNEAIYDLYVIPSQVSDMDTAAFCKLFGIKREQFDASLSKAAKYSRYRPSRFIKQLAAEEFNSMQEQLYKFPGFYPEVRTIRSYPFPAAAHIFGYISEVSPEQIELAGGYYKPGDYIGVSGLEQTYEQVLRGKRGSRHVLVDVHNREQGSYRNGELDSTAVSGKDLFTGLDIDLQLYGEKLLYRKIGGIVAIEPATGEILAMISAPAYNPNVLIGRKRANEFAMLQQDTLDPLYNRPLMGTYPPGSTFKPLMGLMGLEEGTLDYRDRFPCYGGYYGTNIFVGCHHHDPVMNVMDAIKYSCNAYFCNIFQEFIDHPKYNSSQNSLAKWKEYCQSFGLGKTLGIDLPNEKSGLIPGVEFYNDLYNGTWWKANTIISLSIGQGEILVTPLQLANMTAALCNKGYYYPPHIATRIEGDTSGILDYYYTPIMTGLDSMNFPAIIQGMRDVVTGGTARLSQIPGIEMCGKTGTAQNPHGEDHSIFIAFAPKDDPKIAIAVIVENAGGGSAFAAPISSLMIEQYLNDTIADSRKWLEQRILDTEIRY